MAMAILEGHQHSERTNTAPGEREENLRHNPSQVTLTHPLRYLFLSIFVLEYCPMADPLSLLLAEDDGDDSGLFGDTAHPPAPAPVPTIASIPKTEPDESLKMFDASKITLKTSKKRGSKNLTADDPPPAQLPHASGLGLGVSVLTSSSKNGHTDGGDDDLFGLSTPLYSEGNIPGDLFKESSVTKKEEIDTDELLSSITSTTKGSTLNSRKSNEDISDLKIAASLVTKEADDHEESLFGRSNTERVKQQQADTETVRVDLDVEDDITGLEKTAKTEGGNDDLTKLSSLLQASDIEKREEEGGGDDGDGSGFDFASYINSQGGDGGGGGGLFG